MRTSRFTRFAARVAAVAATALMLLPQSATAADSPTTSRAVGPMSLAQSINLLPVGVEDRTGYDRSKFKHWTDADKNSCNTRAEVLIAESRVAPTVEAGCKVTAGQWYSYYDGVIVTVPSQLDVDHMVPLAEAWDEGAKDWAAKRREAYANDISVERSLVAVTAKTNRSKSDQDPADWLPPLADAHCQYAADWVATKLRWDLTADAREINALRGVASGCGHQTVEYEPAA
ncbi:HNH endonuclease family protein [Streptomyces sp. NPDC058155]|uniref:HNH endonuclease family protein n=1 Tax=Streptomyces sp. NPDC058155 TaxID=3346359 RepID=UPI0036E7D5C5